MSTTLALVIFARFFYSMKKRRVVFVILGMVALVATVITLSVNVYHLYVEAEKAQKTAFTGMRALQLAEAIEADIFEIEPVKKYTKADLLWMNPLSRSFREVATRKTKRPEIVEKELDLTGYDKIFLGFPIWGWAAPSIVNAFLEKHDFSGKTIIIFATSGGTTKLDGCVKSLIPSLSETTIVKEGRVLNGEWTNEELANWAKEGF